MAQQPETQTAQSCHSEEADAEKSDVSGSGARPTLLATDAPAEHPFAKQGGIPYQIIWDSTSLGWFKSCPRSYQYRMLEGWTSRSQAVPLTFGILFHKALEFFDFQRAEGKPYIQALHATVREMLLLSGSRDDEGWHPWASTDRARNRRSLIRAVIWHLTQFEHDILETVILNSGKPAVELSFKIELGMDAPSGEPYLLSGHLDRLAEMPGNGVWVVDHKTTGTTLGDHYFSRFSPDNQISLYANAGRVIHSKPISGVIINAVQLAQGFVRSVRYPVHRTPTELNEWLETTKYYLRIAEAASETHYFPMNDKSCFLCPFKKVCSKDPTVRQAFLEADFVREPWNPAEARN